MGRRVRWGLGYMLLFVALMSSAAEDYDVVVLNGRVIDPASKFDAVQNIGITNGKIGTRSTKRLHGRSVVDAKGLVVAPGFIDLHWHGKLPASYRLEAMDGVTSSFELEVGTADVNGWYAECAGKALINHGVSIGHIPVRMEVMHDPGDFLPNGDAAKRIATDAEIAEIKLRLENGLKQGAVAVGLGTGYTPGASHWETLEVFRVAARHGALVHAHINVRNGAYIEGLEQVIAASAIGGAPVHVAHINSSSLANIAQTLQMITEARTHGVDVTTECYPYTAGATGIESALFEGWEGRPDSYFQTLQWLATGERLTRESFARYRKLGGPVILHTNTEESVLAAISSPLTMIASDGFDVTDGKGHPRSSGTYSRVLGRYVREQQVLSLMEALAKMTIQPARRLEHRVPQMVNKGRLSIGADADLTIFDAARIMDRSTYEQPGNYSEGVRFVLVNGAVIVKDGKLLEGVLPGRPIRAARHEFIGDLGSAAARRNPYHLVQNWPQAPAGEAIGSVSWIDLDAKGILYVFRRCPKLEMCVDAHPRPEDPLGNIWTFSPEGKYLRTIADGIARDAHGLRIDRNGVMWVTDTQRHTVKKLRLDGTLVMTLGKDGIPGETSDTFNKPTSAFVTPNGNIYVTDGYGNKRVVKFDRNGKFSKAWGSEGTGEGQFRLPHDIVQDSRGRLFVADRCPLTSKDCTDGRIEIFDENGKFIGQWKQVRGRNFNPFSLAISKNDRLFVADNASSIIWILNARNGEVLEAIDNVADAHGIALGPDEDIYVGSIGGGIRRYSRR